MTKKHTVYEHHEIYNKLRDVDSGDEIAFEPDNQEGIQIYKVVTNNNGVKELIVIGDINGYFKPKKTKSKPKKTKSKSYKTKSKSKKTKLKSNKKSKKKT